MRWADVRVSLGAIEREQRLADEQVSWLVLHARMKDEIEREGRDRERRVQPSEPSKLLAIANQS